eukprot:CAMPEP_0182895094 /NCGR_PEP_ID=MMETSP0034_2-20130328/25476_1 /TAXON_ID=156128 /ORGANISM="Nephroselmis pyriformis, Strain CCMP717" /LENGTH=53 /DNA_ID=CAMNT_0025028905 /DNA_START=200 /DNA_END=357 /DNA_ORIENTATION=-
MRARRERVEYVLVHHGHQAGPNTDLAAPARPLFLHALKERVHRERNHGVLATA